MSHKILVIGATGNVGSELTRLLSEKGESIKAATRNPDQYPSLSHVEPVEFDYDKPATYGPALEGVNRLFMMARNADAQADAVMVPFIDAAQSAGVSHIVLMTAMGVDQAPDDVPYRKVERHLINCGLDYTILRPNWFMQNFNPGFFLPMIKTGALYLPADEAKTSLIDTRDIAAVAAEALTKPAQHKGQGYTLTGSQAIDYHTATDIVSQVTDREIKYVPIDDETMRQTLMSQGWGQAQVDMMAGLFHMIRQGWTAPVTSTVADILGREPITFEQYAKDNAAAWQ